MFDIVQSANEMFNCAASTCKEILPEFTCAYKIGKRNLPNPERLISFLGLKPERDKIAITFSSDNGTAYVSDGVVWFEEYNSFVGGVFDDDELSVSITVKKYINDGKLSVYNLEAFSGFLCGLGKEQIFENFTELFQKCGECIEFQLLNANGSLRTKSIVFSDNDVCWIDQEPRKEQLKKCEDAGVFLERSRIRLVPQDFAIEGMEGKGFEAISTLFRELRIILSYIYTANTANVVKNKAILQYDPTIKAYEFELAELTNNNVITQIYDWVFKDESCVDKASIARKIINTYCREQQDILTMDERIFLSIKSDYVIYQKNHAEQYIDMKNKISEYIVDSTERIQEISHDIADAFRNNFVAIIVFLMTVLLTDSIDFSQFLGKEVSPRVTAVCGVFSLATLLYFIATIIMGNQKWKWLKQSYGTLKNNYKGIFDEKDIEEAFSHDKPLNDAEAEYKDIRCKISAIWMILIAVMIIFTCIMFAQGKNSSSQQSQKITTEVSEASDEADVTEETKIIEEVEVTEGASATEKAEVTESSEVVKN